MEPAHSGRGLAGDSLSGRLSDLYLLTHSPLSLSHYVIVFVDHPCPIEGRLKYECLGLWALCGWLPWEDSVGCVRPDGTWHYVWLQTSDGKEGTLALASPSLPLSPVSLNTSPGTCSSREMMTNACLGIPYLDGFLHTDLSIFWPHLLFVNVKTALLPLAVVAQAFSSPSTSFLFKAPTSLHLGLK